MLPPRNMARIATFEAPFVSLPFDDGCVTAYGRIRAALLALAQDAHVGRDERLRLGEAQLRRTCTERGLDWDRMSEDERESIARALLPEK